MNEGYPHTVRPRDLIVGIDGEQFKKQRQLLYRLQDQVKGTEDEETMEGLCNYIEMIADS